MIDMCCKRRPTYLLIWDDFSGQLALPWRPESEKTICVIWSSYSQVANSYFAVRLASTQLSYHRSFFNLLLSVGDTTRRSCIAFAAAVGLGRLRSAAAVCHGRETPPLPRPLCPPIANPTVGQRVRDGWKKCFSRLITSCEKLFSFE